MPGQDWHGVFEKINSRPELTSTSKKSKEIYSTEKNTREFMDVGCDH